MGIHREHFQSIITTDIQRDILRNVYSGYLRAHKLVKNQEHQPGPAQNLYPYVRWACIDDGLLALNKKYDGLKAISEENSSRNSWYTLISCNNVRMTVSAVNKPTTLPREALFRNDLANCQYSWVKSQNSHQNMREWWHVEITEMSAMRR